MTCNDVRHKCQPYLDGELDCAQRCAIEHHAKNCEPCKAFVEHERAGHSALKRAACDCVQAPADLRIRAFARLDAPPPATEPKKVETPSFARRIRPVAAVAALFVCMAGGYAIYCSQSECRWVVGASDTYDRIIAGSVPVLETSSDVAQLKQAVSAHFPGAFVPCLERCKLAAHYCGEVQVAGCAGHYICYGDGGTRTTLLVVKTAETPRGREIEKNLIASNHASHSLLSWHTPDNQYLCILVSLQPIEQTLPLAEMARAEFAAAH